MNETTFKNALCNWLEASLGEPHTFTITFNGDFVTGNTINGSFDGEAITPVVYASSHAATLLALAAEIQKRAEIFKVTVTGARQLTVIGATNGDTIAVTGLAVTGGASQATATLADVTEAVFIPAIFADQKDNTGKNAPRPVGQYATVRMSNIRKIGEDELREINTTTNLATIGGQRRATVTVNFYGANPITEITKAFNALEKVTILDTLRAAGIAVLDKNDVQNLTGMLETSFQERTTFDFFIGFADNVEDDLGIIETVDLSGTVYTDDGIGSVAVGPVTINP